MSRKGWKADIAAPFFGASINGNLDYILLLISCKNYRIPVRIEHPFGVRDMRFAQVVAFLALVSFAACAEAGVSEISRSAAGRDIIAHCRAEFGEDYVINHRAPPANLSDDDYAGMIRIFDYPEHFNSVAALQADVEDLEPKARKGWDVRGILCVARRRLEQLRNGTSNVTSRPTIPAKAAPQVATNLPKARPERMAPWSPQAMAADPTVQLDPRYAAVRVDALASCAVVLEQSRSTYFASPPAEINLKFEQSFLSDSFMAERPDELRTDIHNLDGHIANGEEGSPMVVAQKIGRCLLQRRLAQLEGSPLIPGAVDGSLNPLSIGGVTPPWKQQGKDKRTIAGNGKSAMHCVSLETIASGDSNTSAAVKGRVLVNNCSDEVEINWCTSPGECERESGNTWTVQPGYSWPVSSEGEVRWSACHGANTTSTVKGSYGLRYYCNAPLVESKRSRKR